jgi:hypothetical protein
MSERTLPAGFIAPSSGRGAEHDVCADWARCSGDLLPPPPPAEKAAARQDKAGQASPDVRNGDGARLNERDVEVGVGATDYAVSVDCEASGHRIEGRTTAPAVFWHRNHL